MGDDQTGLPQKQVESEVGDRVFGSASEKQRKSAVTGYGGLEEFSPLDAAAGLLVDQLGIHRRQHLTVPQSTHRRPTERALGKHHHALVSEPSVGRELAHALDGKRDCGKRLRVGLGREFRSGVIASVDANGQARSLRTEQIDGVSRGAAVVPWNERYRSRGTRPICRLRQIPEAEKPVTRLEVQVIDDPICPSMRAFEAWHPAMAKEEQQRDQSREAMSNIQVSIMFLVSVEHRC